MKLNSQETLTKLIVYLLTANAVVTTLGFGLLIFIDTSSLVKRYIEEDDSSKIDELFIAQNEIAISPITAVEMTSVFNPKDITA